MESQDAWMRVANINMTLPDATCPDGLMLLNITGPRVCGPDDYYHKYANTTFPLHQYDYTEVCGQVRGYRYDISTAFTGAIYYGDDIDGPYVAGVSITYDSNPRKHMLEATGIMIIIVMTVSVIMAVHTLLHHSLVVIIIVNQLQYSILIPVIYYGMVNSVMVMSHYVVLHLICHGLLLH